MALDLGKLKAEAQEAAEHPSYGENDAYYGGVVLELIEQIEALQGHERTAKDRANALYDLAFMLDGIRESVRRSNQGDGDPETLIQQAIKRIEETP